MISSGVNRSSSKTWITTQPLFPTALMRVLSSDESMRHIHRGCLCSLKIVGLRPRRVGLVKMSGNSCGGLPPLRQHRAPLLPAESSKLEACCELIWAACFAPFGGMSERHTTKYGSDEERSMIGSSSPSSMARNRRMSRELSFTSARA